MTDLDEMLAFTRAQILADRAAAEAATTPCWHLTRGSRDVNPSILAGRDAFPTAVEYAVLRDDEGTRLLDDSESGALSREDLQHIARHDPRDGIADCDAKLTAIRRCEEAMADPPTPEDGRAARDVHIFLELLAELVLRDLAQGYRHRPGFREDWAA